MKLVRSVSKLIEVILGGIMRVHSLKFHLAKCHHQENAEYGFQGHPQVSNHLLETVGNSGEIYLLVLG
jgi:hypothetical protein